MYVNDIIIYERFFFQTLPSRLHNFFYFLKILIEDILDYSYFVKTC